jgi:CheY-like chemotaxis protein
MPVQCFEKRDSDQPVCGVHNVRLVQDQVPIDANAPWLGLISCSFCPVGRIVVEKRWGRMGKSASAPISKPHEGLKASFPIVALEEIPAPEPSDAASALRPVILVVDGERAFADELTESLNRSGYAAIATYDAETALETALLVPPDLAVIDAWLSGSSGIELATSLQEKLPDCKIVMSSWDAADSEVLASVKAHLSGV